jgi:hypothetical protein
MFAQMLVEPQDSTASQASADSERSQLTAVDLSFQSRIFSHSGLATLEFVEKMLKKFPMMRTLVLVLKNYLHVRKLNNPYTGGLSSYSLIILVIYFLQQCQKSKNTKFTVVNEESEDHPAYNAPVPLYAELFFSFLDFYGRQFDFSNQAISVINDGFTFAPPTLCVVWIDNPLLPGSNVASSTFAMWRVKQAFLEAYVLLQELRNTHAGSALRILLDENSWESQQSAAQASDLEKDAEPGSNVVYKVPRLARLKRSHSQDQLKPSAGRQVHNKFEEV